MRVLGIDPGYAIVGWGVVDYGGNRFAPVDFGAVCTDAGVPFERRLDEVYTGIKEVIERTRPEVLAIEKLFYQHNQTTVSGAGGPAHLRVHPHAGQAGSHRLRQGSEKAGAGNDPRAAASARRAKAGRYR